MVGVYTHVTPLDTELEFSPLQQLTARAARHDDMCARETDGFCHSQVHGQLIRHCTVVLESY